MRPMAKQEKKRIKEKEKRSIKEILSLPKKAKKKRTERGNDSEKFAERSQSQELKLAERKEWVNLYY